MNCVEQLLALTEQFVQDYRRGDAVACADVYTHDAIILHQRALVTGRAAIIEHLEAYFEAGYDLRGYTTLHCHSEGMNGFAIQTVHSNEADIDIVIGLRRTSSGIWYLDAEATVAARLLQ